MSHIFNELYLICYTTLVFMSNSVTCKFTFFKQIQKCYDLRSINVVGVPLARGDSMSRCEAAPPALSPKIVTFPGSPPKFDMFFCTHLRAITMSLNPAFPGTPNFASFICKKEDDSKSKSLDISNTQQREVENVIEKNRILHT